MIHNDTKKCSHCQDIKSVKSFPKRGNGLDSHCKICRNKKNKNYRVKNPNKVKAARKRHYDKNLDKMRADKRKYCESHKEDKREYDAGYRDKNRMEIKKYKKAWERKNKDNPIFKIKRNLRRRVHHVLKGRAKVDKTFNLIGCSANFFKSHIEFLWKDGMNWENYGPKGWHIDHIIPCYKFNLLLESEQRRCFHYSNQRPLWCGENLSRKRD